MRDFNFKLRENWMIQHFPGIQHPCVHRQMTPEKTDDRLKMPSYEPIRPGERH